MFKQLENSKYFKKVQLLMAAILGCIAFCIIYGIKPLVLVNNCVGDFVWRFMQSLESLYL